MEFTELSELSVKFWLVETGTAELLWKWGADWWLKARRGGRGWKHFFSVTLYSFQKGPLRGPCEITCGLTHLTSQHFYMFISKLVHCQSALHLVNAVDHVGGHVSGIQVARGYTAHLEQGIDQTWDDLLVGRRTAGQKCVVRKKHIFFTKWKIYLARL